MIRVFVIDDHPLMRIALKGVLEAHDDLRVVGEAANGPQAMPAIAIDRPDVVLCDFHLPGWDGLEVTRRLLADDSNLRILIVSVIETGPIPRRLLAAGARGYVSKAQDGGAVVRAVREVAAGRRFLDDTLGARLLFESSPFDDLSFRQLEVARLLVEGRRTEEIAIELGVTVSTIRSLRATVLGRLGIRSEVALTRLAMEQGLIPSAGWGRSERSNRDG